MIRTKPAPRKAAPTKSRARSAAAKRSDYNKWYKNPALSDITVVYGRNGERKYTGHRLMFCNVSQWFANASKKSFFEANQREIQFRHDDPDALEAFFEFAYKDDYTVPKHGDTPAETAKNQFMHHLRTYVVADKYMAENLADFALQNVEYVVKTQVDNNSLEFYKFAVKIVYQRENIFEHEEEIVEEETVIDLKQDEDGVVENGEVERYGEEKGPSDVENTKVAVNDDEQSEDEGNNMKQLPVERVKAILVAEALHIWSRAEEGFDRYDVAKLVKKVPNFGTDIAIAALKSLEVEDSRLMKW